MRDIELYRHVLGLESPWTVARVDLGVKEQRVDVWAEHRDGHRWACPECGTELPLYDHAEERAWRHLDTCQFLTYLHARPPRVRCPDHGVRQVRLKDGVVPVVRDRLDVHFVEVLVGPHIAAERRSTIGLTSPAGTQQERT